MDMHQLIQNLSCKREIFHSEADFQHSLAWEMKLAVSHIDIRLEVPLIDKKYTDIVVIDSVTEEKFAIELKYPHTRSQFEVSGEKYSLGATSETQQVSYNTIKDISRIEELRQQKLVTRGFVIMISNTPDMWNAHTKKNQAAEFFLSDGIVLEGLRSVPTDRSGRFSKNSSIELSGKYPVNWLDYSKLKGTFGHFKYLIIEI